jgi:hypothetical protein
MVRPRSRPSLGCSLRFGTTSLSGGSLRDPRHEVSQPHWSHSGDHSRGLGPLLDLPDPGPRHRASDSCARQPRRPGRGRSGRPAWPLRHRPVPGRAWPQPRHRPHGSRRRPSPRRPECWATLSSPSVPPVPSSGARSRAGGRAHLRGWSPRRGAWLEAPGESPLILSPWQPLRRHPTASTGRRRRGWLGGPAS